MFDRLRLLPLILCVECGPSGEHIQYPLREVNYRHSLESKMRGRHSFSIWGTLLIDMCGETTRRILLFSLYGRKTVLLPDSGINGSFFSEGTGQVSVMADTPNELLLSTYCIIY